MTPVAECWGFPPFRPSEEALSGQATWNAINCSVNVIIQKKENLQALPLTQVLSCVHSSPACGCCSWAHVNSDMNWELPG